MPIGDLTLISILHTQHTYAWRITATKKLGNVRHHQAGERELRELRELRRKPHG